MGEMRRLQCFKALVLSVGATAAALLLLSGLLSQMVYQSSSDLPFILKQAAWRSSDGQLADPPGRTGPSQLSRRQILLATHGRSGSTYTGDIIRAHPDMFYLFEPLKALQDHDGIVMPLYRRNELENASKSVIRDVFNCAFDNLTDLPVHELFRFSLGDKRLEYCKSCIRNKAICTDYFHCLIKVPRVCLTSRHMLVKTIRFRLRWAEDMLKQQNSDVRVLYLIRDPRAVIASQMTRLANPLHLNLTASLQEFCPQLREDVTAIEELSSRFPHTFKVFWYEHGALDPLRFARDIYEFLGLNLSQDIASFVKSITSAAANSTGGAFSTRRSSSEAAMNAWRLRVSYSRTKEVERLCGDVLPKLGYKLLASEKEYRSNSSLLIGERVSI